MDDKKMKLVYTIVDRGEGKKAFWCRIGTGWQNRDGSINIKLDATPVNGQLHIRDYDPARDGNTATKGEGNNGTPKDQS